MREQIDLLELVVGHKRCEIVLHCKNGFHGHTHLAQIWPSDKSKPTVEEQMTNVEGSLPLKGRFDVQHQCDYSLMGQNSHGYDFLVSINCRQ